MFIDLCSFVCVFFLFETNGNARLWDVPIIAARIPDAFFQNIFHIKIFLMIFLAVYTLSFFFNVDC
jgi:hypothetical protein